MANRFWVATTGDWDNTAGSKWSLTSGGPGGAAVPTSSDDVFFDSGSSTNVNLSSLGGSTPTCKNIDFTGYTHTFSGSTELHVYGSWTFGKDMTNNFTQQIWFFGEVGKTNYITSNGISFKCSTWIGTEVTVPIYKLADNFFNTSSFFFVSGSFDANGKNVTASGSGVYGICDVGVSLGSGTWTLTGTSPWNAEMADPYILTLSPGGSTLKFTHNGVAAKSMVVNGTESYNKVWVNTTGAGVFNFTANRVTNNFNINELQIDAGRSVTFTSASTTNLSTFSTIGIPGSPITMRSSVSGATYTFSKTLGLVASDWLDIKDCHATGGARWYAGANSTNTGANNTGWVFADYKKSMPSHFIN